MSLFHLCRCLNLQFNRLSEEKSTNTVLHRYGKLITSRVGTCSLQPLEGLLVHTLLTGKVALAEATNWRTFKDPFLDGAYIEHGLHIAEDEEAVEIVATSPVLQNAENSPQIPDSCNIASYSANEPSEDRFATFEMQHGELCAGVFDGHGGWQASEYVQKRLCSCLMMELESMNPKADLEDQIEKAMKRAFGRVEREFIYLIKQAFEAGVGAVSRIGSCGLLTYFKGSKIFVANAGDCRAVLGRKKSAGKWESVALSSDHNIREPNEQLKLRRWHPAEDNVFVCKRPGVCYVKGCLQPTRSFGDAYLKYPEFNGPPYNGKDRTRGRHIPPPYTPPYITAQPEVVSYDVQQQDEFVILGTDGLWDFFSNEEAVEIVAQGIEEGDKDLGKRLLDATLEKIALTNQMSVDDLKKMPLGRSRRSIHDDTTIIVVKLKDLQQNF